MKSLRSLFAILLVAALVATVFASTARAASLVQVTNFGTNPTGLAMYLYVPANVQAKPAILLAGRSYNAFTPEASQSVAKKISSMGVTAIPADCFGSTTVASALCVTTSDQEAGHREPRVLGHRVARFTGPPDVAFQRISQPGS